MPVTVGGMPIAPPTCVAALGPEAMVTRLFDSMVSVRVAEPGRDGGHLGLGLYIVRLVAEFHGGRVRARNLSAGGGARFEVEVLLP